MMRGCCYLWFGISEWTTIFRYCGFSAHFTIKILKSNAVLFIQRYIQICVLILVVIVTVNNDWNILTIITEMKTLIVSVYTTDIWRRPETYNDQNVVTIPIRMRTLVQINHCMIMIFAHLKNIFKKLVGWK